MWILGGESLFINRFKTSTAKKKKKKNKKNQGKEKLKL